MPSATLQKYNEFKQDIGLGAHNLDTGVIKFALTNTAPTATDASFTTGTYPAPAAANGYTALGHTGTVTYTESGGTGTLALSANIDIVATAGGIGPFRYVVVYNDTTTSPVDALIGWFDYGSSITLASGETFTINSGTLMTIA